MIITVFNWLCCYVTNKSGNLLKKVRKHKAVCFCCGTEHYSFGEKNRCPYCGKRLKTFLYKR